MQVEIKHLLDSELLMVFSLHLIIRIRRLEAWALQQSFP